MERYGTYRLPDDDIIDVRWHYANPDLFQLAHVLYALLHPQSKEILLIGQAYQQTIWQRFKCQSKNRFVLWAREEEGLEKVIPLVGDIEMVGRLTKELISDIESLLIFALKPRGNRANILTRDISRPGMVVRCIGDWPERRKEFVDPISTYKVVGQWRRSTRQDVENDV